METQIRESSYGGFAVEIGMRHSGGERIPGILGVTMPAFIVYESANFDTRKQAVTFAKKKMEEGNW